MNESIELNDILELISQKASFSLGKSQILNTKPSFNELVIRRDNARIKEALDCVNKYGPMPFNGAKDIISELQLAQKGGTLNSIDFLAVIDHVRCVREIKNYMKEKTGYANLIELSDTLVECSSLKNELEKCFNEYGEVRNDASPALYGIRMRLSKIDAQIMNIARSFIAAHPDNVVDNIISTRDQRVCILMKLTNKNSFGGFVHGLSASGQAVYVEPGCLIDINNEKMNLLEEEKEEIHRILLKCSNLVKEKADILIANVETMGILDSLFAGALWGHEEDGCVADIVDDRCLYIKKGRHPLIDKKKVVRNTYQIKDNINMVLVTGPNTGGKTVGLKTIGLSVLLTYCGLPICADEASICLFDQVYIDIGDDQSVIESLSTFSAHLSKLAYICNNSTSSSLVLLDELGSGTDPKEGESLALAVLNYLRKIKAMSMITTHYNRLKAYGKRHEDVMIASVEFDMEKLEPTYRYLEGFTGQSNAFNIARRYGLKNEIVKDAVFLSNQSKTPEENLMEKLEKQISENESLKLQLSELIEQNKKIQEEIEQKESEITIAYENRMIDARNKADEYVDSIKMQADEILANVIKSQKDTKFHTVVKESAKLKELTADLEDEVEDKFIEVNDTVIIRQTGQLAKVTAINRNQVTLNLNGVTVRSKLNQIKKTKQKILVQKKKPEHHETIIHSMPLECNLIGMRVDEAMEVMGKYVDDAKVCGLNTFRIIHGDGTGALRKAVHEALRKDKSVKEFRLGMPNEGGSGATIVTLQ